MSGKIYEKIKLTLPFVILSLLVSFRTVYSQQTPINPVSYRIFSPFIFNPAVAGSKDFSTIDLLISNYGESNSQIASGNLRLSKSKKEYYSSLATPEFSNVGLGGYLFNDYNGLSRNTGIGGTGSYHFQLDKNALSFIAIGATAKAVFNNYSGDPDNGIPSDQSIYPNLDAGVFYYNANLYAGISVTNLLGSPNVSDSLSLNNIPVSRQFFLNAGYKIVIDRSNNFLLEPFLIINTNDSLSGEISQMVKPGLKFYANNFCIGTYFNDFNKISFFAQYKYNRITVGTYFETPYKTAYYLDPIIAEFTVGINLSSVKSGYPRRFHW